MGMQLFMAIDQVFCYSEFSFLPNFSDFDTRLLIDVIKEISYLDGFLVKGLYAFLKLVLTMLL